MRQLNQLQVRTSWRKGSRSDCTSVFEKISVVDRTAEDQESLPKKAHPHHLVDLQKQKGHEKAQCAEDESNDDSGV
jgi:hypothetical protein